MQVDSGSGSSLPYSIPPRSSQKLTTSGSAATIQTGSVIITPSSGTVPPVGAVVFTLRQNGITITQAGVPAAGAAKAYRLYGEASGNFDAAAPGSLQTGIAIYNRANTAATVTVELFRQDGSSTGLTGSLVVPASGQVATYLNRIPGLESMPSPFQGVVRVSNSSPISVIGLRGHYNERAELLTTTTPSVDESATPSDAELFFPHVVKGGGFTTQVILFNGSAGQQSTGDVRFATQSGDIMTLQ
jgi:hypothetical protein